MKIRVAICTRDEKYAVVLTNYFNAHYYDKFSWNVYTDPNYLHPSFRAEETDIVLLGKEIKEELPAAFFENIGECLVAWLTDQADEEQTEGEYEVEKYHRADRIYRDLLDIYSHKGNVRYASKTLENSRTEMYAFISPCGGVGTSTIAMAAARRFAKTESVLYLSIENINGISLAFQGEGKKGFDEIIYALKSRRKTLELKLESNVSRDKSGVFYFEECENGLELNELSAADIKELLVAIQSSGKYDKVIIDVGDGLQDKDLAVLSLVGRLIIVTDKSEVAEAKLKKYIRTLRVVENVKKVDICSKLSIFMNRVGKNIPLPEHIMEVRIKGSLPQMENGTYLGIIERLTGMESLQNIK